MRPHASLLALVLACGAVSAGAALPSEAWADEAAPATFAVIIGSNVSVDSELPPLKYADDDAARYLDLFRVLGARTYLLSRLDDNTRRLHPQAAAEAMEPKRAALENTMVQVAADVARARDRHLETALYIVYAGHGNVRNGEGYITLEDMRITGGDLAKLVKDIPATHVHIIADACASYYLAYSRGPGGERRELRGFQDAPQLADDPRVGLLLSTSSARESHEWDEFQAGVFSHEVRSGLYGAADADGDGRVSYKEIAAFVSRANAAIPNERFRPDVHAHAPAGSETLLDIRKALGRRIEIDGAHAAHYWIEDSRGVRLLDFHNAKGQSVGLVRPAQNGRVYVRRVDDDVEFTLPSSPPVIALADLEGASPRVASRGAAQEAFALLFSLGFDLRSVRTYTEPRGPLEPLPESPRPMPSSTQERPSLQPVLPVADARQEPAKREAVITPKPMSRTVRGLAWTGVGVGAAGLATGAVLSVVAIEVSHGTTATTSEASAASRQSTVSAANTSAAIAYPVGGVALVAGVAALLFWPGARHVQAAATPSGGYIGYSTSF
jgi:hypothetical protein